MYLDLQQIIMANSLVVHLVIRIIRITAAFVFDKCKPTLCVNDIRMYENVELWILTDD